MKATWPDVAHDALVPVSVELVGDEPPQAVASVARPARSARDRIDSLLTSGRTMGPV